MDSDSGKIKEIDSHSVSFIQASLAQEKKKMNH